jgi:hypothetical protein
MRDELDRSFAKGGQTRAISTPPPAALESDAVPETNQEEAKPTPTPAPAPDPRRVDRRIERLEDQLAAERNNRDDLRDRVARAEKLGRDADRRRISELNKAEAVLRDVQHSVRSERRAYKILQFQYEAQIERAKAAGLAMPEAVPLEPVPTTVVADAPETSVADAPEPVATEAVAEDTPDKAADAVTETSAESPEDAEAQPEADVSEEAAVATDETPSVDGPSEDATAEESKASES